MPAICATAIVGMGALIFGLLWFARFFIRSGSDALKRTYDGLEIHAAPQPGDVEIVFDTYYGFLGGGYQNTHRAFLPPEEAEIFLRRLHSFNLRWSWLCPEGLFVLLPSFVSYRKQLKSIRTHKYASLN